MAVSIAELIGDALAPYALIAPPFRAISTLVPHVVIEELHNDELVITDHPVEIAVAISDHAFKRPNEVDMRVGRTRPRNLKDLSSSFIKSCLLSRPAASRSAFRQASGFIRICSSGRFP